MNGREIGFSGLFSIREVLFSRTVAQNSYLYHKAKNCAFASMSTVCTTSIASTNARKTVSGRVIHKIFRADLF
jgi:hypothetical protein